MFLVPVAGLLVPDPEARPPLPRHLAAAGAEVPDTEYWRRRIEDGSVVLAVPPAEPATAAPPEKKGARA